MEGNGEFPYHHPDLVAWAARESGVVGRVLDPSDPAVQQDWDNHRESQPAADDGLESFTAAELMHSTFDVDFIVDGLLVAGQNMVVGGPQKTLKTSLLIELAISICSGTQFLSRFDVPSALNVGIISAESGVGTLAETSKRVAQSHGFALDSLGSSFVVSPTMPQLTDRRHIKAIEKFIDNYSLSVICLDPAYLMMNVGDKSSNVFSMGAALTPLSRLCSSCNVTVVVAHHSKGRGQNAYQPMELSELAFAGWQEWARQWMLLSRRGAYKDGSGQHLLWMRVGGSVGHGGLWGVNIDEGCGSAISGRNWDVEAKSAKVIREDKEREAANRKAREAERAEAETDRLVRRALEQMPGGATQTAISSAIGRSGTDTRQSLMRNMQAGHVRTGLVKAGNRTCEGYILVTQTNPDYPDEFA